MNNRDVYDLLRSKPSMRAANYEILNTFQQRRANLISFAGSSANSNPAERALLRKMI